MRSSYLFFSLLVAVTAILITPAHSAPGSRSGEERKLRREHPGCLIWWFLDGCPFGRIFGVDPFGIYPWKKFCTRYTAFDDLERCQKYQEKKKDENDEETKEEIVNEEDTDDDDAQATLENKAENTSAEVHFKEEEANPETNNEEISNSEEDVDEESKVIDEVKKVVEEAHSEEETQSGFVIPDNTFNDAVNFDNSVERSPKEMKERQVTAESRFEKKCRSSFNFYNANLKTCRVLLGKKFKRTRREIGENYKENVLIPNHPGCMQFWFLKGCPLGDLFGVDPFDSYPWQELCKYPGLQSDKRCQNLYIRYVD